MAAHVPAALLRNRGCPPEIAQEQVLFDGSASAASIKARGVIAAGTD